MNLAKTGRQLRREASTNPKKAVFLGLAVVVAAYFWTPLVWGWIGKNDKGTAEAVAPSGATPVAALTPAAMPDGKVTTKDARPDRAAWSQIVQQMRDDPRMMTAPPLTIARDPFESPKDEVVESKAEEEAKSSLKPLPMTPSAAGLVLTSTIIGQERRIAQISGKTYVVGQAIEAVRDKETVGVAFKLVEVHPRRAILEADGQRFELTIPEPDKSSKIEFFGVAGKP